MQRPCYGCERRCQGCHGHNPDGSWRCEEYGRFAEANAARLAARAAKVAAENDVTESRKTGRRRR